MDYLTSHPGECGVAAAALRVYERVIAVRDSGAFLILFNPSFEPFVRSSWENVDEVSHLCRPPVVRPRIRASAGTVTHRSEAGQWRSTVVRHTVAHCVQHLMSELDGDYWCPPSHTVWSQR